MEPKMRQIEAIRVTKWMAENPKLARRFLNGEECTTAQECLKIIDSLCQQSLEYLVPILLYTMRFDAVMDAVQLRMNAEGNARTWEHLGTEQMMKELKNKIKEEMQRREQGVVK